MRKKSAEGEPEDGGTAGDEPATTESAAETRGAGAAEQPQQGSSGAAEPAPQEPSEATKESQESNGAKEASAAAGAGGAKKAEKSQESTKSRKSEDAKGPKKSEGGERAAKPRGEVVAKTRSRVAQLVWLLFVVAAVFLAVGALCVALGANKGNGAVQFILDGAKFFDLGVFSRKNGIKTFGGDNAATKNALFNWGIAAVLYLVVGRIVERIIRP